MNPKETKLRLAILSQIQATNYSDKCDFWLRGTIPSHNHLTIYSEDTPPELETVLKTINKNDMRDTALAALTAIGWKFIWGQPTPGFVTEAERKIKQKGSGHPEQLTLDERLLITIFAAIDTDMF
jgi:hypothetical protein